MPETGAGEAHPEPTMEGDPPPRIFSEAYYARLHAVEHGHWYISAMRELVGALLHDHGFRSGGLALDAGCGTGGTVQWLSQRFPGSRPVGVDLASEALRYVRRDGGVRACRASVTELPFRSSTFDLVLSFDILQHLPRATGGATAAMREAARVLHPGGFLVVRAAAVRWGDPESCAADAYHRYRLAELVEEIRGAGFTVLRATPVNCIGSLVADARQFLRGSGPVHGDPGLTIRPPRPGLPSIAPRLVMRAEAFYLRHLGARLPWGHALLVLASRTP